MLAAQAISAGFLVAFSLFAVALVALLVYIAVWAIRKDAAGRKAWEEAATIEEVNAGEQPPTQ